MSATDDGGRRGGFTERMSRVQVTARSQDGTVHAHLQGSQGIKVEFSPDFGTKHTEESLALQITMAVKGATKGASHAHTAIHRKRWGSEPEPPGSGPRADHLRRLGERLENMEVCVLAPRGYVQVRAHGLSDLDIRIEPGTLRRVGVTGEQLASEVNFALARTGREWIGKWMEARASVTENR